MKKINQIFALFALMLITSCVDKEVNDDISKSGGTFTRMNIDEANTLFIASSNSASKMYGFKQSSSKSSGMDDEIFEIKYFDENEEPVEKNNPDFIYDAGDFIYVFFLGLDGSEGYFVKKSDGSVYPIPLEYCPPMRSGNYEQKNQLFRFFGLIQFDKNKNIYYPAPSQTTLLKVTSVALPTIRFSEVSMENDIPTGFCVDEEGQIIYTYRPENASAENARCRKPDGSFVDLPIDDYEAGRVRCFWKGTDGLLYGFAQADGEVSLIKTQDGQIAKIRNVHHDILLYGLDKFSAKNVFEVQGKIIYCIRAGNHSDFWYLIDISNESTYKETPCTVQPNMIVNDQLCYFDDETFSCTLINVDNGETSLLFDLDETKLNDYDIDKIMMVTETGVVFSAVHVSDNKNVVAKIGLDNTVAVQQTIEGKVSVVL